jgi:hypothetical protein
MSGGQRGPPRASTLPDQWEVRVLVNFDFLVENLTGVPELVDCLISTHALTPADGRPFRKNESVQEENAKFVRLLLDKGKSRKKCAHAPLS